MEVLSDIEVLSGKVLIDCNNFEIPEGFAYPPIELSKARKISIRGSKSSGSQSI